MGPTPPATTLEEQLRIATEQVAGLRSAIDSRAVIERAKGLLMAVYDVDADMAWAILRRASSHANVKVSALAETLSALIAGQDVDPVLADVVVDQLLRPAAQEPVTAAFVARLVQRRSRDAEAPRRRLAALIETTGAAAGVLWRVSRGGVLRVETAIGYPPDLVSSWPPLPSAAHLPPVVAARTGRPVLSGSQRDRESRFPGLAASPTSGAAALACLPVITGGQAVTRVLGLSFTEARSFGRGDERRLQTLVHQHLGLLPTRPEDGLPLGTAAPDRPGPPIGRISVDFDFALEVGSVGVWYGNPSTQRAVWTRSMERLFGLPPGGFSGHLDDFYSLIHPDDREAVMRLAKAPDQGSELTLQHRIVRPDGHLRWIETRARPLRAGEPQGIWVGVAMDITELKTPPDKDGTG